MPLDLVKRAVERSKDSEVDECWCVFDVEAAQPHPNLEPAVRLAEQNGIRLAISNPCFELWLILHHQDRTAYVTTSAAEKLSRSLDERHERNQTTFPRNNPSSTMHRLLEAIEPPR